MGGSAIFFAWGFYGLIGIIGLIGSDGERPSAEPERASALGVIPSALALSRRAVGGAAARVAARVVALGILLTLGGGHLYEAELMLVGQT